MKKTVEVTVTLEIEVDESKFDEEFMQDFKETFYALDTVDEHIENIAREIVNVDNCFPTYFMEGYGPIHEMGISWKEIDREVNAY